MLSTPPAVLAGLVGATENHVVDTVGREAGALHERPDGGGREVIGANIGERGASASDRSADRSDYVWRAHDSKDS